MHLDFVSPLMLASDCLVRIWDHYFQEGKEMVKCVPILLEGHCNLIQTYLDLIYILCCLGDMELWTIHVSHLFSVSVEVFFESRHTKFF